jgi:hypothetical protein
MRSDGGESDTSITADEVEAELRRMLEEVSGHSNHSVPLSSLFPVAPQPTTVVSRTQWSFASEQTAGTAAVDARAGGAAAVVSVRTSLALKSSHLYRLLDFSASPTRAPFVCSLANTHLTDRTRTHNLQSHSHSHRTWKVATTPALSARASPSSWRGCKFFTGEYPVGGWATHWWLWLTRHLIVFSRCATDNKLCVVRQAPVYPKIAEPFCSSVLQ